MQKEGVEILLVEDSPGDVELTRLAIVDGGLPGRLAVAEDGEQALRYLRREREFAHARRPDLILLDLHLPRLSGHDLLAELKADPELTTIPVIILSSSGAQQDIVLSYRLHANCYLQKPAGLLGLTTLIEQIRSFWLETALLPTRGA